MCLTIAPRAVQGSTVNSAETDSQRFIRALQKLESSAGRYSPGSLLLAQDPNDLNRCAPPNGLHQRNPLPLPLM